MIQQVYIFPTNILLINYNIILYNHYMIYKHIIYYLIIVYNTSDINITISYNCLFIAH